MTVVHPSVFLDVGLFPMDLGLSEKTIQTNKTMTYKRNIPWNAIAKFIAVKRDFSGSSGDETFLPEPID